MTTTNTSLSTREVRTVVSMLAAGRDVDFVAQALSLPRQAVGDIRQQHGPDADTLRRSAAQLLHQLDAEAGRAVSAPSTPPPNTPHPAAPQTAPRTTAPGSFSAGMVRISSIAYHPSNLGRELGDLRDLAASIKKDGVRVPVVLEQHAGRYRLRDGHRRVAAANLAGLTRVPAIVHAEALDDRAWILEAIDYNLRRQGYTDDDKRRVARQLADLGVSHSGIAQAFGVTTAKLAVLIAQPAAAPQPVADRPKRAPTSIGRRTLTTAVQDWRSRDADATTILDELEHLLAPVNEQRGGNRA